MFKLIILGAIQGLTEFFPVSSSGHLVIAQHVLNITKDVVFLDIFLHIGTVLALLTFFRKDILLALKNPKMLRNIAVVTLITGVIGITFKKTFESLFNSAHDTAIQLLINGAILWAVPFFKDRQRLPGTSDSVVMGIAQGISIIPGISRSGLTISSLLALGVKREEAFRFSFIASIPAIVGAFLYEAKDLAFSSSYNPIALSAGLAASYLFGLLALSGLGKAIHNKKFHLFGYYCVFLAITLLFFFKI
jgi:undecaprenyl-diphosphatase